LLEDDFQFILCEGCHQESPDLKLLTCLHTLCLSCLSKNKLVGQCPVCQTAIPQAGGIPDTDNLLFTSLQAKLKVYKKIIDTVDLFCNNCKKAGEFWCSECEDFFCITCFEAHRCYLKRDSHEAKRVMDIRAGSATDFLKGTRETSNLSCSNPTHKSQTASIYCPACRKPMCCVCALLDNQHTQFRDVRDESRRRQEELSAMSRELRSIQNSLASLQEDFGGWARSNTQQVDKLLKISDHLLQAQHRANRHLVSMTREMRAMSRSLATITPAMGPLLQPTASPQDPCTADMDWMLLPSDVLEFPPSTPQKHEGGPAAPSPSRPSCATPATSPACSKSSSSSSEGEHSRSGHPTRAKRGGKTSARLRKRRRK
ncbi:PREDICTED: protein PML-like, partial [Tauraco erythrolophus]|uniref:protein PML-like n=1 Tax=Tauraco erythrolophus TaxID=121530 RepID=UPI00052362A6